jgi:pSer/pThr/pTyr-binding forkhead associated (FHA) protein
VELFVITGPDAGRSFTLGPQSVLGRDPTATVHLLDAEVSRRHASLTVDEGKLLVEDLGSSNGTFVDEARISEETEVQPGQRLRVGQTIIEVRAPEPAGDPENLPATKVPLPELTGDPPDNP